MSPQSKPQRRLTRADIQEILEKNILLYREDEHFATYLVELALYLLEYEYDWADSGMQPPVRTAQAPRPAVVEQTTATRGIEPSATLTPSSSPAPVVAVRVRAGFDRATPPPSNERRIISSALGPAERPKQRPRESPCPYCGTVIGDAMICPACRNLVK